MANFSVKKPGLSTRVPNPMKTAEQSVKAKMPKIKKPGGLLDSGSLLTKNENFDNIKHPNLIKLRSFLKK